MAAPKSPEVEKESRDFKSSRVRMINVRRRERERSMKKAAKLLVALCSKRRVDQLKDCMRTVRLVKKERKKKKRRRGREGKDYIPRLSCC